MKLYVGNLSWDVRDDKLKEMFSKYGCEEASVIIDRRMDRSKGFGFVTIPDDEKAKAAISEMNESEVEGRKIVVNEARPRED